MGRLFRFLPWALSRATFFARIRTGLATLGRGWQLRMLLFLTVMYKVAARVLGGLLVGWGASIFVYALISYHRACVRLSQENHSRNSLGIMIVLTTILLIIAMLVFWITL